jgi:hypothetical protein
MNYIDTSIFSTNSTEYDFYLTKIIGSANINPLQKQIIEYILTPTYYIDNTVYFDYRASILNLLITTPLSNYKTVISIVLQMKEDEDNYKFKDNIFTNQYSIYDVIYLISTNNKWDICPSILLDIRPSSYDLSILIFNKYDVLKQLDIYLNTNIADQLYGLYQRQYILK